MVEAEYIEVEWLAPGAWPSFSRDGASIVFTQGDEINGYTLATVPSDRGATIHLKTPQLFSASRPDWSWSPSKIAFTGEQEKNGHSSIHIYDLETDAPHPVPNLDGYNLIYPSWYFDGVHVAAMGFNETTGSGQHMGIYKVNTINGAIETLFQENTFCAGRPSINTAGTRVVMAGREGAFNQQNNQVWQTNPLVRVNHRFEPPQHGSGALSQLVSRW